MKVSYDRADGGYTVTLYEEELLGVLKSLPGGEDIPADHYVHFAESQLDRGRWEIELLLYPPAGAPA